MTKQHLPIVSKKYCNKMKHFVASLTILGTLSCLPISMAQAQDCDYLDQNVEWNTLFRQMNAQAQAEDYKTALETFKKLSEICSTVPSANYTAGMINKKLKNYKDAYGFLMVATRNTKQFAVDEDLMKRMWYALYETEFPEVVDFRSGKVQQQHQEAINTIQTQLDEEKQDKLEFAETMMWTGTGVGIAGVVIAVVGGVIMGRTDLVFQRHNFGLDIDDDGKTVNILNINKLDGYPQYQAGTIVMGIGIAAAVTGAIFAGIGGYKYIQSKAEQSENNEVSFNLSHNNASLSVTF